MDEDSITTVDEPENEGAAQTRDRHEVDAPSPVITIQGCIYISSASIL